MLFIAALFLFSACTLAETPATAPVAGHVALKPRKDVKGVSNFAQVSEGVYRGAQPTAEGFAELKKMGIKTIINLRSAHDDSELLKGTGLNFIQLECDAAKPNEENIIRCMKIIDDAASGPVFVHCARGADRTGLMIAVYRMTHQSWTADEALAEMPNFKFNFLLFRVKDYLQGVDAAALLKRVADAKMPELKRAE